MAKKPHEHKPAPMVDEVSDFEVLEIAVRELAIEKGLFSADDHRRWTENVHSLGPLPAARLVAKAWLDPEYKKLAVTDGVKASLAVGVDWINSPPTGFGTPSDYCNLRVLEDTPKLKHVVVCTLCSCYPRPILGQSPEWYRTPNYRRRLVRWPRQVLAEFGRHRGLDRGSAGRDRDAGLPDRRGIAQARGHHECQTARASGRASGASRSLRSEP